MFNLFLSPCSFFVAYLHRAAVIYVSALDANTNIYITVGCIANSNNSCYAEQLVNSTDFQLKHC